MLVKFAGILVLISGLLACSCSNYHLGSPVNLPFKTVYIAPVKNNSFAPQAYATLTNQLSNAFLSEGALTVETEDRADTKLQVVIVEYNRGISATDETDTQIASSVSTSLDAKATLTDNRTGKLYFKDVSFSASGTVYDTEGFQQAEYQIMPILARDLSRKIHQYVISMW